MREAPSSSSGPTAKQFRCAFSPFSSCLVQSKTMVCVVCVCVVCVCGVCVCVVCVLCVWCVCVCVVHVVCIVCVLCGVCVCCMCDVCCVCVVCVWCGVCVVWCGVCVVWCVWCVCVFIVFISNIARDMPLPFLWCKYGLFNFQLHIRDTPPSLQNLLLLFVHKYISTAY